MSEQPELPAEPPPEVLPWQAVQEAFELMLAAHRTDPMHELPETKEAVRAYQTARAHANRVAPKANPKRLRVPEDQMPKKAERR